MLRKPRLPAASAIALFFSSVALAQFPLSEPVTGDTVLEDLPCYFEAEAATYPWDDGMLLVITTEDGPRMVRFADDGAISGDFSIIYPDLSLSSSTLTPDGLFICGSHYSTWPRKAAVALVNEDLSGYDWIDTTGYAEGCSFSDVTVLSNGDVLACGSWTYEWDNLRPYARRLSPTGQPIWTYSPASGQITFLKSARELGTSDLLFTGANGPPFDPEIKTYALTLTGAGDIVADEDLGLGDQSGQLVMEHPDGGSVIWGTQNSPINLFVAKVNDLGLADWSIYHPGLVFGDALFDPIGSNYVVTGKRNGQGALVARFNLQGDTIWTRTYGVPTAKGLNIRPDGIGGFFITGTVGTGAFNDPRHPYLLRVNADGMITGQKEVEALPPIALRLAPNPSGTRTSISTNGVRPPATWEVLDALGRPTCRGVLNGPGPYPLDCDGLSSGTYLLRLRGSEGLISSARWMVE